MEDIEKSWDGEKGGAWRPIVCEAVSKVCVLNLSKEIGKLLAYIGKRASLYTLFKAEMIVKKAMLGYLPGAK